MAFQLLCRGVELTQQQLDAIVPTVNANMQRKMGKKKFEQECIRAMKAAGCPLIVDGKEVTE